MKWILIALYVTPSLSGGTYSMHETKEACQEAAGVEFSAFKKLSYRISLSAHCLDTSALDHEEWERDISKVVR